MLLGPAVILAGPQAASGDRHGPTGFPPCVAGTYLGEVTLVQPQPFTFRRAQGQPFVRLTSPTAR
jgi:hypothetical protein